MGQQGISAVQDAGDGVDLMGSELDSRVDTHKVQMAPVVLPGADAVELLIVELTQPLPALRVFPNPILERLLDKLLLTLGNGGLFLVQNRRPIAMLVLDVIKDTDSAEIQGLLNDFVAVGPVRAIGAVRLNTAPVGTLALNTPIPRVLGVVDANLIPHIPGSAHKLIHELIHHINGEPGSAQADGNLRSGQVCGLHRFQSLYIDSVILGVELGAALGNGQFLPDIAGQVLVGGEIFGSGVGVIMERI